MIRPPPEQWCKASKQYKRLFNKEINIMFNEMNKGSKTIKEGIETRDMEFRPLKDFCGRDVPVDGFFFTDGRYGRQVVLVGCGYLINMPSRATAQFEQIAENRDMVQAVLDGHLKLTGIKMVSTRNGETTGYNLTDC